MYFKKQQQKKDKQIYLWNLYHISDLILQQTHKHGKLHPKQNQATRRFKTITQTHTHSRTIVFCMNLCENASENEETHERARERERRGVKWNKQKKMNQIEL